MSGGAPVVDEVDPSEAYRILEEHPEARLIDVRTRAEWTFVGLPDLSALGRDIWPIEWVSFPSMAPNAEFLGQLKSAAGQQGGELPRTLLFICRSGSRSMAAARSVATALGPDSGVEKCINVAEGFEGDLDPEAHRGRKNGWKARGLPWRQS